MIKKLLFVTLCMSTLLICPASASNRVLVVLEGATLTLVNIDSGELLNFHVNMVMNNNMGTAIHIESGSLYNIHVMKP
jgi:N-dimethylarginine dimethylaminohydrolase